MNTKSQARSGVLAGLLLLAVVILMTVAPTAGAMRDAAGPATGSVVSVGQTQLLLPSARAVGQHEGVIAIAPLLQSRLTSAMQHELALDAMSTATGSGTTTAAPRLVALSNVRVARGTRMSSQFPPSSGVSSPTVWIAVAVLVGVLFIGVWAFGRRRVDRETTPDCELAILGC